MPVVPKIKSFEGAYEIDVPPKAANLVVPQPKVLELRQRFQVVRDVLNSAPEKGSNANAFKDQPECTGRQTSRNNTDEGEAWM